MEGEKAVRSASAGFVVPYLPEAMDIHLNQQRLVRIASLTRGRLKAVYWPCPGSIAASSSRVEVLPVPANPFKM